MSLYFSDAFGVNESAIEEYGAFNISLITDLPLFVDPFLLFNSKKPEYQKLHDEIIRYLRYLKEKSIRGNVPEARVKSLYRFSEIKQNWLGFCQSGNSGRGLGGKFARSLNLNLASIFENFGNEQLTRSSHLEKLCLIDQGVGRDMISDFTTNLIKDYLLTYTQAFAEKHISKDQRSTRAVSKSEFNYELGRWMPKSYELPIHNGNYVILTPKDILTKDEIWINHSDLVNRFENIPDSVENSVLRAEINEYFYSVLPKEPKKEDHARAVERTLRKYPELIDYYLKYKEDRGSEAEKNSKKKVSLSDQLYIKQFGELINLLHHETDFYKVGSTTADESLKRILFLKDVIENKGGHKIFYIKGKPLKCEMDLHILYRLTWCFTPSDVSREVNDGRGPADYKISRGNQDKTIVEFKLASNTHLRKNLVKQTDIYKKASDASSAFKVILYFSKQEFDTVSKLLKELKLENAKSIILIDARNDNKPSGSTAS